MPTRSNACSELVRFWLEARHGLFVTEGVPVPVPYALSDIDFAAIHPRGEQITLPGGNRIGPQMIVETKDEHDFDPKGLEFGKYLRADVLLMADQPFVPAGSGKAKFTMLREQHFKKATEIFGSSSFDRIFVVHAIDPRVVDDLAETFHALRIHWLSLPEVMRDLLDWYRIHQRPSGLRNTLTGDLWHLLVGYCRFDMPR